MDTSDTSGRHAHDRVVDRLSEHLDGLLVGEEAADVERHLAGCVACRDVLADLERIRDAARGLSDSPPERDLWPGIRRAITGPSVVPLHGAGSASEAGRSPRGVFLSMPQLAAAAVLLLTLGGAGVWLAAPAGGESGASPESVAVSRAEGSPEAAAALASSGPAAEIGSGYAAEVERLEDLLDSSRDRLSPATVRVLEKNLAIIDRAILESMEALQTDPANPWVRDHLRRSWERKVDYLRDAAALAEWGSTD